MMGSGGDGGVEADYAHWCADCAVPVNSGLRSLVPSSKEECGSLRELDWSKNIIGSKGMIPMFRLITTYCPNLVCVNLAQNYLDNSAVGVLYSALVDEGGCPALISIELANNPISNAGGKLLSRLADARPQTRYIGVRGTLMNVGLARLIEAKVVSGGGVGTQLEACADAPGDGSWPAIETLWRLAGSSAPPPEGNWSGLATVMAVVRKDDTLALATQPAPA